MPASKALTARLTELNGFRAGEPLSGFTETEARRKAQFHNCARYVLKEVAKTLDLKDFEVRSNKAGPAIGGDVSLYADGLYICIGESIRNLGILYRYHEVGRRDGPNQWMQVAGLLDFDHAVSNFRRCLESKAAPGI
jgi:hypothetical protein